MFDIAWSEMAVIALVALVVIGPKDLPKVMKQVTFWIRRARHLAAEFQSGIDEIVREAELDEARKAIEQVKTMDIAGEIEKTVDPTGSLKAELSESIEAEKSADAALKLPAADSAPPLPAEITPEPFPADPSGPAPASETALLEPPAMPAPSALSQQPERAPMEPAEPDAGGSAGSLDKA